MTLTRLSLYDRVADEISGRVIRRYSTSFGLASRLLEPRVRQHVENIYALVRVADEIVDHRRVGERRGVAEIAVLVFGDLAQNPAHDLSRARLRQTGGELNEIRRGDGADLLAHPGDQLLAQIFARAFA